MKPAVLLCAGLLFGLPYSAAGQSNGAEPHVAGTWDLTWQTRKGPTKRGYMVVTQRGNALTAQIYGQGSVKAKGTLNGDAFTLRGSRLAVPYTIAGRVQGQRMTGSLKVLSGERRFTGDRRKP